MCGVGAVAIRAARPEDAEGLAEAWREFGRYYADIDPNEFRVPNEEGLADWFKSGLTEERPDDSLWLVAERDNRVIGFVRAQIWSPAEDAGRQILRETGEPVLKVDSISVRETDRLQGVGSALMSAAENWGRQRGATRAVVISYANSPSSVPFYEDRMGYTRHTIGFLKSL